MTIQNILYYCAQKARQWHNPLIPAPDPTTEYDPVFLALQEEARRRAGQDTDSSREHCLDLWGIPTEPAPIVTSELGMGASQAMIALLVAVILLSAAWCFIEVGKMADTQENDIQHNTARLKSLGLLPAQPIRVIERESQPSTFLSESMGVPAEVAGVAGQGGAR